jgi:hypothetical protein
MGFSLWSRDHDADKQTIVPVLIVKPLPVPM